MTTVPDYKLDPPVVLHTVPPCPVCGAELYAYLYEDTHGDIAGCTECVKIKDPWEYAEGLHEE